MSIHPQRTASTMLSREPVTYSMALNRSGKMSLMFGYSPPSLCLRTFCPLLWCLSLYVLKQFSNWIPIFFGELNYSEGPFLQYRIQHIHFELECTLYIAHTIKLINKDIDIQQIMIGTEVYTVMAFP